MSLQAAVPNYGSSYPLNQGTFVSRDSPAMVMARRQADVESGLQIQLLWYINGFLDVLQLSHNGKCHDDEQ